MHRKFPPNFACLLLYLFSCLFVCLLLNSFAKGIPRNTLNVLQSSLIPERLLSMEALSRVKMTKREPGRYHNKAIFNRPLQSFKRPSLSKWGQVLKLSCENAWVSFACKWKIISIKGEEFNLVLIRRPGETRKWPIFLKGSFGNKAQDKRHGRKIKLVADTGEEHGGPVPPPPHHPLFFDQNEARRTEKSFLETGSSLLSQGLDDRPPAPPPPLISKSGSATENYL